MVKQKINLLAIAVSLFVVPLGQVAAVDQTTIDAVKEKIAAACPVRWEDHTKPLQLPELASDALWQDVNDKGDFIAYITTVVSELGSGADPEELAADVNTVAAECAMHRTALLDLLLVQEPNELVVAMRAMQQHLDRLVSLGGNGLSAETAAKDCKSIKETFPDSQNGSYWIDVNGGSSNDALEVFCDMTTDGGGWTFVAFLSSSANLSEAPDFFNEKYGEYQKGRVATESHYSLGILPQLEDTEMIVTFDVADIDQAVINEDFSRMRYGVQAPGFNFGPLPCTPSGFQYSKEMSPPDYQHSYGFLCTSDTWFPTIAAADTRFRDFQYLLGFKLTKTPFQGYHSGGPSVVTHVIDRNGQYRGGSYSHKAWIYVR